MSKKRTNKSNHPSADLKSVLFMFSADQEDKSALKSFNEFFKWIKTYY